MAATARQDRRFHHRDRQQPRAAGADRDTDGELARAGNRATLDAIHLASALVARSAIAGLDILSLDERIRKAASLLGVRVLPEQVPSRSKSG